MPTSVGGGLGMLRFVDLGVHGPQRAAVVGGAAIAVNAIVDDENEIWKQPVVNAQQIDMPVRPETRSILADSIVREVKDRKIIGNI